MRGNVMDLAVGVIIGAAFGKIVTSLVEDVLMPPIGQLVGKVDFAGLFINLGGRHFDSLPAAKAAIPPGATLNYGIFINNVINFLIIAFVVFLVVQQMNRLTKKPAPAAVPTTKDGPQRFAAIGIGIAHCGQSLVVGTAADCPQCAMPIPIAAKRCG